MNIVFWNLKEEDALKIISKKKYVLIAECQF